MSMIKAYIFDFAGVITTTDAYWQWIRDNNLEAKRAIFEKLSEGADRGSITHEQFIQGLAGAAGVPEETIWPEVKKRFLLNTELISLIGELKKKGKIGLLSNFTYPWLSELLEEHNLRGHFDKIIISSREGMIKPEPEIFHKMLNLLESDAREAVFFDDKQPNVDGAKKVGMHAFLFTTNEQFRDDVRSISR